MQQHALKEYTDTIIADESHYPQVMNAVHALHDRLVNAGCVSAKGETTAGTFLKAGYALSAHEAARCALDLARTRMFGRGILQAIRQQLNKVPGRPLHILYAGCGPYVWLALLACPYFRPEEIQFTPADIHPASIASAKIAVKEFGLEKYFKEFLGADVLTLNEAAIGRPDILILEAMKAALHKEPQVTLAAHLVRYLAEEGIMIPERIEITPAFTEMNIRFANQIGKDISGYAAAPEKVYENIAVLDKNTALAAAGNIKKPFAELTISLDEDFCTPNYDLELRTVVTVWEKEKISLMDSAISLPVRVMNGGDLAGEETITFRYVNSAAPGFKWQIN